MTVEKTNMDGKCVLAIEGRLDTMTAPQLQTELMAAIDENANIILDFNALGYVSSAGLRVLVGGAKQCKAKGGEQLIINVSPEVQKVFAMTGLANVLKTQLKA